MILIDFIAMDFETASFEKHSACSIALVVVRDNTVVDSFYSLIQPETQFNWKNIQIHGIQPEDVIDAPKFPDVWREISGYFSRDSVVIAHNAAFDNAILKGCLSYYGLPAPHYLSLCTVRTSRKLFPEFQNHKLNTVSQELNIPLDHHHNALDDSLACARILIYELENYGIEFIKPMVKLV